MNLKNLMSNFDESLKEYDQEKKYPYVQLEKLLRKRT